MPSFDHQIGQLLYTPSRLLSPSLRRCFPVVDDAPELLTPTSARTNYNTELASASVLSLMHLKNRSSTLGKEPQTWVEICSRVHYSNIASHRTSNVQRYRSHKCFRLALSIARILGKSTHLQVSVEPHLLPIEPADVGTVALGLHCSSEHLLIVDSNIVLRILFLKILTAG